VVAAAVKILRRMYPSVGNPTASAVHYWGEQTPFVGGAKTYVPVDGDPRHFSELAQPLSNSRLLFAGEATCAKSYGTFASSHLSSYVGELPSSVCGLGAQRRLFGGEVG
jgi:hypothetical protein